MRVIKKGTFYGTGSGSAAATIPQQSGQIVCRRLGYTSAAAGTLDFYLARARSKANAAVSADTTLVVKTDSNGYFPGESTVMTTNDYVLVSNSTAGGTVFTLSAISAVAAVSSSTVSLTLATAVTCLANDPVFLIRAADIISTTTAEETVRDEYDAFAGYRQMPVHILLTATGTDKVSGVYHVED